MRIELTGGYYATTTEFGFDLYKTVIREKRDGKGTQANKTGEKYEASNIIGYGFSSKKRLLSRLIQCLLADNQDTTTFQGYLEREVETQEQVNLIKF